MPAHPTTHVGDGAKLGREVEIGPFTIVHPNVEIGDGTVIGGHCELGVPTKLGDGSPLVIGPNSMIRSHSVFYESSSFGHSLTTGHRVTVRELTRAGDGLQIGTMGDVQGHCKIGDYVKFHSNVHVGHGSHIENFVWIFPYVVLTNDPHPPSEINMGTTLRRFSSIATMSVILPGVIVGEGALVAACSCVTKDVEDHHVVAGNPAQDKGLASRIKLRDGSGRNAYPWATHFRRGYPESIIAEWDAMLARSQEIQG